MKQQSKGGTVKEQRIKAFIIQYEDSIRYHKKLLDCYFAEALLSDIPIYMKNPEKLETQLKEKTNECEQLKILLETAHEKVTKLYAKQEENSGMKEFLDFAVFLSSFRDSNEDFNGTSNSEKEKLYHYFGISLDSNFAEAIDEDESELNGGRSQSDEITAEDECSKLPSNVINEDILTLNSKLKLAQESLDAEKLKRKQLECERDNLDDFSEKLCYLLYKYQKRIGIVAETRKKSKQTTCDNDHSGIKEEHNYSSFEMKNTLQTDDVE